MGDFPPMPLMTQNMCKFRPRNAQKCLRPCALRLGQSQFCWDDNAALIGAVILIRTSIWFFGEIWCWIYDVLMVQICQSHPSLSQRHQPGSAKHFSAGLRWLVGAIAFQNSQLKLASEFTTSPPISSITEVTAHSCPNFIMIFIALWDRLAGFSAAKCYSGRDRDPVPPSPCDPVQREKGGRSPTAHHRWNSGVSLVDSTPKRDRTRHHFQLSHMFQLFRLFGGYNLSKSQKWFGGKNIDR